MVRRETNRRVCSLQSGFPRGQNACCTLCCVAMARKRNRIVPETHFSRFAQWLAMEGEAESPKTVIKPG